MKKNGIIRRIALLAAVSLLLTSSFTSCKSKPTSTTSTPSAIDSSSAISDSSQVASSSEAASAISIAATSSVKSSSKQPSVKYDSKKTVFNSAATKKESKISLNNSKIIAPSIPTSAVNASPIKRTTIEGVDGSFIDPKINETVKDLGGANYTFATFWPTEWNGKDTTANSKRQAQALKDVQTAYNCKINIITMNTGTFMKQITSARTAGKVYANIFDTQTEKDMQQLYINGNFADVQKVNSINFKTNQWNPVYSLISSYKGGVYGLGLRYDNIFHDVLIFNTAMAAKYNLGDFYSMVDKGQWTDDLFLQVCQQFKKVNTDKTAIACTGQFPTSVLNLLYYNYTSPLGITENKYIFNGTDDSVLNMLNYIQDFVKEGLYDRTASKGDWNSDGTWNDSNMSDYVYASTGFFNSGKFLFFFGGTNMLDGYTGSSKIKYGLLPFPKGPSADNYSSLVGGVKMLSLFNGDPNVENSGILLTAILNRTNISTSDIMKRFTQQVEDDKSINTLVNLCKYKQILGVGASDIGDMPTIFTKAAMGSIMKQTQTPMQAMQSIQKSAQAAVDKSFGQTS